MLLESNDRPVNPHQTCEQAGDKQWKPATHPPLRKLLIRWSGGTAPTVMDWPGWDTAAAYLHAENMAGMREGDLIVLYALNWQASWAGRA